MDSINFGRRVFFGEEKLDSAHDARRLKKKYWIVTFNCFFVLFLQTNSALYGRVEGRRRKTGITEDMNTDRSRVIN